MDKQLKNIMILLLVVLPTIVVLLFAMKAYWLAWVSVCDGFLTCGSVSRTEITLHDEVKWKEIKPLEAPKKKEPMKEAVKVEKPLLPIKKQVTIDKCTSKVRTDLVNHAYLISGGDMKFLWTISSESMWDVASVGDHWKSFGLCQIHKWYNPSGQKAYRELKTDKEKLEYCYKMYKTWNDKGIVENRLYGSRVYKQGLKKVEINCK